MADSPSFFHATAPKGGANRMDSKNYYTAFSSPLGPILMHGTATALRGLSIVGSRLLPPLPQGAFRDDSPLRFAREQVEEFLGGQRLRFSLPIELQGSRFQLRVWHELLATVYGETLSYGEVARRLDSPTSARAVGSALGRNPLLLVVPCHRVIAAGGALGGYSGGLEQKQFLLSLEKKHADASMHLSSRFGAPL